MLCCIGSSGDLDAYKHSSATLKPSADKGIVDRKMAETWAQMAQGAYGSNPEFRRDEAIRSASMAAMALMFAAQARGFSTGPMIGFNPKALTELLGTGNRYLPVMTVTLGYALPNNSPRKVRFPVTVVAGFNLSHSF